MDKWRPNRQVFLEWIPSCHVYEKKVVMKSTHLGFKETKQNTDSSKFKSWFLRKENHKKRSKWHWEELLLQLVTLEEDTETHLSYQFLTILNSNSITLLHMLSIVSQLFRYTNPVVSLYLCSLFSSFKVYLVLSVCIETIKINSHWKPSLGFIFLWCFNVFPKENMTLDMIEWQKRTYVTDPY